MIYVNVFRRAPLKTSSRQIEISEPFDYQGIIKHKSAEPHLGGRRIVTSQQRGQTGDLAGQKVLSDRPENTTPVKNSFIRHPDEEMEQESSHKDMNDNRRIL